MESTDRNVEAVQQNLDQLISAAEKYQVNLSAEDRYRLVTKTTRLVQTLRGPADMLFAHLENTAQMGALRTLLEAGVFHAIPTGGKSISAAEISKKTGVDKELIVRYMRAVTPVGPFQETGEEQYAHTPFSEIYLAPQMRAIYDLTVDEYAPPMLQGHKFFRQKNWKHEISPRDNQYTFAHDCEGQTMFEHVAQSPDRLGRLSDAMTASDSSLPTVGIYPIVEELGPLASDDTVTLVDVGGGRGHVIRQIKESAPNLKGRFILQDEAHVIQDNGDENKKYGIEAMAHDFFQPQPVKGALAYYLRRCLHDWPNEPEGQKILSNLAAAMDREKSRVLITECVVPEVGATMFHAWMDQGVMTIGGRERTEKDWAHLLDISGLKLVKVWRAPEMSFGVVEARLK